ncbi:MAG: tetratricopeptide repeat protein, partial [Methanolinea sp.]|nr:tetratricopeptide repeat protein [Methanolinea sp.]
FDRSLEESPRNIRVLTSRGIALRELGRYEESIRCFDRALELNALNYFVYYQKSLALRKMGRDQESEAILARINAPWSGKP